MFYNDCPLLNSILPRFNTHAEFVFVEKNRNEKDAN